MPTTQRLLTDETGQALVTAVNNIVAAVKPNATEIQMSSSDTTTVATAITNINNKIGTVPSGQTVEEQITTLNSNFAAYHTLKSGETDVSAGNVRIPLNYNGHKYVWLEIKVNSQTGNPAGTRGSIFIPMINNQASATYLPFQAGSVSAWTRLEVDASGLLIIAFGGASSLFVEGVNGIGIVG